MQQQPDMQQLLKLAQSDAGKQLMYALRRRGDEAQKAAALAADGHMEQAKQALSGFLDDPEIQKLLRQLEGHL